MKVHKILILHYLILILICFILISFPFSYKSGNVLSFSDRLFIATSAVCVTGLTPVDIGKEFSFLGQIFLIFSIKLGGLSLASFFIFFSYLTVHKLNLFQRKLILTTYSSALKEDFKPLIFSIVFASLAIELFGAFMFLTQFLKKHGFLEAIWYSIFHSISAFCNAGFSLYSENLSFWQENPIVIFTASILIFLGGIGFIVISEIFLKIKGKEKLSLHSIVTIKASIIFIFLGMILFLIFEWNGVLKDMGFFNKFYISLFHSITPRTCGFNLVRINLLNPVTLFLTIFLMFIGASSGSCGGGIKVNTFYISFLKVISKIKGESQCHIKSKAISNKSIEFSFYLIFLGVFTCFLFTMIILVLEGNKFPFLFSLFEVVSAFGTVGLSCGITSELFWSTKIVLSFLMLFGRIGPLVFLSILQDEKQKGIIYSEENLLIG